MSGPRGCWTRDGSGRSRPEHARIPRSATTSPPTCWPSRTSRPSFGPVDLVLVESGGDNLTATFSPALVDAQMFVIDVAGGGDVARKGGPGIERADLLVVNKTDLAPHVGVDVDLMRSDALAARDDRPVVAPVPARPRLGDAAADWVRAMVARQRTGDLVPADPGPMAPHVHAEGSRHDHGDHVHAH